MDDYCSEESDYHEPMEPLVVVGLSNASEDFVDSSSVVATRPIVVDGAVGVVVISAFSGLEPALLELAAGFASGDGADLVRIEQPFRVTSVEVEEEPCL